MADTQSNMLTNMEAAQQPVDAQAEVKVSQNRLEAHITVLPPQNGGAAMIVPKLIEALAKQKVSFGIKREALESIVSASIYGQPVLVARGNECENGENAKLSYFIRLEKDMRPKELPDGSVDFRDLNIIEHVQKDALLCQKQPATPGRPGKDVYGQIVSPKPGKDARLPQGKNTVISSDGLKLFSAIEGQADYINGKINVLDTFTLDGDVSTASGNVLFSGNVVVRGNVMPGFTVQASGNVDISGMVESAHIIAGGNLIIRGGFNGGDSGEINAGGNATLRFIQGGKVNVTGNIESTYILNAAVNCGGTVNLTGRGLILGGHVLARVAVFANTLGSASAMTPTTIEVGSDPNMLKRFYEIPKLMETCMANIQKIESVTKILCQLRDAGRLPPDKADQLVKSVNYLNQLRSSQDAMQEEYDSLKEQMASLGSGIVKAFKSAYPGVKIVMGTEQFPLKSDYPFTSFTRTEKGITAGPAR